MDPEHKALLRTHRLELSGQLLVSDTIVPFLYQENILTETQVEDIESQSTNRQKCLRLLDVLPSRGPRAFDSFLRSLEDFSWVRDQLLLELQTRPGPGSTGESTPQQLRQHVALEALRWEEFHLDWINTETLQSVQRSHLCVLRRLFSVTKDRFHCLSSGWTTQVSSPLWDLKTDFRSDSKTIKSGINEQESNKSISNRSISKIQILDKSRHCAKHCDKTNTKSVELRSQTRFTLQGKSTKWSLKTVISAFTAMKSYQRFQDSSSDRLPFWELKKCWKIPEFRFFVIPFPDSYWPKINDQRW